MTKSNAKTAVFPAVATMMLALSACTAEKIQEGELPEVEVKGRTASPIRSRGSRSRRQDQDRRGGSAGRRGGDANDPDGKITDEPDLK